MESDCTYSICEERNVILTANSLCSFVCRLISDALRDTGPPLGMFMLRGCSEVTQYDVVILTENGHNIGWDGSKSRDLGAKPVLQSGHRGGRVLPLN